MQYNRISLWGRLTSDPEFRTFDSGSGMAKFTIATDNGMKNGQRQNADFFNCTAWGKLAEFLMKNFSKGNAIMIDGEIHNNNYEKDGHKVYSTNITVTSLTFGESKRESEQLVGRPIGNTQHNDSTEEVISDENLPW